MLVTVLVKPAQSKKFAKGGREIVIQVQNSVFGTEEGSGDPQIKLTEYAVFPLGETAEESCDQIILGGRIPAEDKAYTESFDGHVIFPAAGPP